ncbi:hypothetical protein OAK00_02665 [Pelagibacteraceae bacterium]|jgi:hypothetical protein|nr:hypothetical protein [Pelagibacteraceae bacterium]|tara:strand:+ start:354 stop:662 length:309 start_codon:yes stop_codon:yes gene_type:complete
MKKLLKTKIKLPEIDSYDFPYKFYKCYWSDIESDSSWNSIKHIKNSKPAICITMGWLLSTTKGNFCFCSDINFNHDGTINEGGNSTVIPKSNILKLKEIKHI